MRDYITVPPELEDLANEVGDFICYWGFKKIHGRIWTHLYLSEAPLDASQLMQRLGVSKALISLSLNDLLKYEVILESGKSARGTQTYVANPDVISVILNVLRRRERKMLTRAETSHRMLHNLSDEALKSMALDRDRIASLGLFIEQAQEALNNLLDLATIDLSDWEVISGNKKSL